MKIAGGEFELIKRIKAQVKPNHPRAILGIGDDAAILPRPSGTLLACIDMLVENIHFISGIISPWQLGWKALAVNISDIAAMGGTPLYALVSIGLNSKADDAYIHEIYEGLTTIGNRFGVEIVGGDTVRSPEATVIDVAVIGEAKNPITRSGAKEGDLIAVTGHVGSSAAGLAWLLSKSREESREKPALEVAYGEPESDRAQPPWAQELIKAHLEPIPQVEAGQLLASTGMVTAMIDISDGVASEVNHIAEESRKGAIVYANSLPISKAALRAGAVLGHDPLDWALFGGEDYELIFTFRESGIEEVKQALEVAKKELLVIGRICEKSKGVALLDRDGTYRELPPAGYNHFANR